MGTGEVPAGTASRYVGWPAAPELTGKEVTNMSDVAVNAIGLGFLVVFYLLPSIVALWNAHTRSGSIVLLNLLTGWTLLGWGVAMSWGMLSEREWRVGSWEAVLEEPEGWVEKLAA